MTRKLRSYFLLGAHSDGVRKQYSTKLFVPIWRSGILGFGALYSRVDSVRHIGESRSASGDKLQREKTARRLFLQLLNAARPSMYLEVYTNPRAPIQVLSNGVPAAVGRDLQKSDVDLEDASVNTRVPTVFLLVKFASSAVPLRFRPGREKEWMFFPRGFELGRQLGMNLMRMNAAYYLLRILHLYLFIHFAFNIFHFSSPGHAKAMAVLADSLETRRGRQEWQEKEARWEHQ
ncbi:hypothetical protein K438DRAFT_1764192 [Mycena galopus ATCC 62051]|nr:hypothetical protein K438DRAFT_1764192 [Mycena galopus ATCC 62051]